MKIILAIDDPKFSREAIRMMQRQIRPQGAKVCVLHMIEPVTTYISADLMPHFVANTAQIEEERKAEAKQLVTAAARELRHLGFKASEVVECGRAQTGIIDCAARWGADLILVGSHAWKGLDRFLLGSVSEAVVRHAGCSVQIVRIRRRNKQAGTKR